MTLDRPRTVLVVENDPPTRRWLTARLRERGYEVTVAGHAQAAVAELQATPPDVVCLDLVLPRESGYDLLEFMRKTERFKNIPVLVLSDKSSPLDRAHAEEAGASRYIVKPLEMDRVPDTIAELLAGPLSATSGGW